jgi:hypothetical protein
MKLTKLQKKTLQFFNLFRTEPPTIGRQLRFNWFAWLPLLIIAVLGCVVLLTPGFENAGWLWIGLVVGAFFRDIGRFRGLVRVWPVYKEIINWQRISELLESNEKHDA